MDGNLAPNFDPFSNPTRREVQETFITQGQMEAARLAHAAFEQLSVSLISRASDASGKINAALSGLALGETTSRELALAFGEDVRNHPAARQPGQLFALHMQIIGRDAAESMLNLGDAITRMVILPVGSATSPRGNLSARDATEFYDEVTTENPDCILFSAYPSGEIENVDPIENARLLSEAQVEQLQKIQLHMLRAVHQAQAAAMESGDATALVGLQNNLMRMGASLTSYQDLQTAAVGDADLATANQAVRNDSRAVVASVEQTALRLAGTTPALQNVRLALNAGVQDMRALGVLAEKRAPQTTAVPRASMPVAAVLVQQTAIPATTSAVLPFARPGAQISSQAASQNLAAVPTRASPHSRPSAALATTVALAALTATKTTPDAKGTPPVPTAANPRVTPITKAADARAASLANNQTPTPPQTVAKATTAQIKTGLVASTPSTYDRPVATAPPTLRATAAPATTVPDSRPSSAPSSSSSSGATVQTVAPTQAGNPVGGHPAGTPTETRSAPQPTASGAAAPTTGFTQDGGTTPGTGPQKPQAEGTSGPTSDQAQNTKPSGAEKGPSNDTTQPGNARGATSDSTQQARGQTSWEPPQKPAADTKSNDKNHSFVGRASEAVRGAVVTILGGNPTNAQPATSFSGKPSSTTSTIQNAVKDIIDKFRKAAKSGCEGCDGSKGCCRPGAKVTADASINSHFTKG